MTILNSIWMNEELRMLHDSALKFTEQELGPNRERWEAQGMCDRDAWRTTGAAGLLCASIPVEYGGAGGDYTHEAVIYDAMIRGGAAASVGGGNTVHSQIVAHYILDYGTEDQKHKWLPAMAAGELVGAIAMTEPGAGSDLQGVKTTAVREGDEYIINGAKTFISNGQHAELIIVVAKTDPAAGAKGTSLIVVETEGLDGFARGRNLDKVGLKDADTSELFFNNVRVPTANLLGDPEGQGFIQLMMQLPQERLGIACAGATIAEMAVETTLEYTRDRAAFGKSVFDFQNTRFKLAECKTEATIARSFVDQCIAKHINGELSAEEASMAKWWCTQKQCDIVDECLQLHGGYGYMWEYPIARMYADSRVQKIYGGTNEIMKELIARSL
ncbi:acyl-CoA dehydrogenase [Halioglobus japonicus]|uniref:Acyl-[acyl-carrier-protein] dehydrogenase MbtN n=1 Tax=Halioglobus japonicus TaxID=930805 RepID=A0AAP8MD68_9GAMM|nr:acyl-CoA dehydrogenase family protein [Halioglobus japonicus]AQA17684.1 acyl-CoA dehydrogenase [Halioglobus japonicus]PLW85632.1 acyl-CoA dehydrogenase [Halioglobus japonicus]GHD16648.1 acyl-CoA dehydrogenase [Halioglobus japonicus]